MTTETPAAARAMMTAEFQATIARLQTCTKDDTILAWTNGLAVKFHQDAPGPQIEITSLDKASPIDPNARISRITNGHGDEAERVRRQDAIAAQIASLRSMIADLQDDEAGE